MRNNDLIERFIQGETKAKGSNLKIEGNKLINYTTCIAYRIGRTIYLDSNQYSSTTSRHQNYIRRNAYNVVEMAHDELKKFVFDNYDAVI